MRKTFHFCLSSHDEVMYRSEADLIMGFNCLALAVLDTETRLLAEGFLPTHHHYLAQTDDLLFLEKRRRYTYTRYFNAKYHRRGSLGERPGFFTVVSGTHHILTAMNYVLRQGLHHGLATTAFDYDHGSANCLFRKELGKHYTPPLLLDERRHQFLPHHRTLPPQYRMASNGLILREDIVDTAYAEECYTSARNFLYQMNRLRDSKIAEMQVSENGLPPVTLESIENGVPAFDLQKALNGEQGKVDKSLITDLEMCHIIDDIYLPNLLNGDNRLSIYDLSFSKREDLGNTLWRDALQWRTGRHIYAGSSGNPFNGRFTSPAQIRRCLALNHK